MTSARVQLWLYWLLRSLNLNCGAHRCLLIVTSWTVIATNRLWQRGCHCIHCNRFVWSLTGRLHHDLLALWPVDRWGLAISTLHCCIILRRLVRFSTILLQRTGYLVPYIHIYRWRVHTDLGRSPFLLRALLSGALRASRTDRLLRRGSINHWIHVFILVFHGRVTVHLRNLFRDVLLFEDRVFCWRTNCITS